MPLDNAEYLPPSVQVLLGADRLLAKPENWIKKKLSDGKGGLCIAGAVSLAGTRDRIALCDAWDVLEHLVGGRVVCFNDAPGTTFSDIKALLQEAIELESAKVAA